MTTRASPFSLIPSLCTLALCAAFAAPSHAETITFETGYGMIYGSGESHTENGYRMTFESFWADAEGTAVGAIIDGSDPFGCVALACPIGNPGMYYGALNDSIIWLSKETSNAVFQVKSFDASFIGSSLDLASYPFYSGLLRLQGLRRDGNWLTQDFLLEGPQFGSPGEQGFAFGQYATQGLFSTTDFVALALYGYTCNTAGMCDAFTTNRGQFAIDNISLVPEPATGLLVGLGLLGVGTVRRRVASHSAKQEH